MFLYYFSDEGEQHSDLDEEKFRAGMLENDQPNK